MEGIKIKMMQTIRSDMPFKDDNDKIIAYAGQIYEAEANINGAISIIINNKKLGLKPFEFMFIEAPSWLLDKHNLLVTWYDSLIKKNEQLKEEIEELKEEIEELKEENKELIEELKFCYYILMKNKYPDSFYLYHLKKLLQEENNETNETN